jgi:hypothetical protein
MNQLPLSTIILNLWNQGTSVAAEKTFVADRFIFYFLPNHI